MDDRYYRAFLEGDHEALGETLKPFSLWHNFLLQALESPFLTGERVEVEHVVQACEIFKTSFPNEPNLRYSLKQWFKVRSLKKNMAKLEAETKKIAKYIEANSSFPRFWQNQKTEKQQGLTSPETLAVVISLIQLGFEEGKAWDMSLARARWYEAAAMERQTTELKFFYEDDLVDAPEDLTQKSEEELYEIAVRELGERDAKKWLERRQNARY